MLSMTLGFNSRMIFVPILVSFLALIPQLAVATTATENVTENLTGAETLPAEPESSVSPEGHWFGSGASLLFGLGIGHMVTNRFESVGYKYAIADGVGLAVATVGALAVMGDCAPGPSSCRKDSTLLLAGVGILFVSRVLQVYDVVSFGSQHGMWGTIGFGPTSDGRGLVTTASSTF